MVKSRNSFARPLRFAVRVIEGRPRVRISLGMHGLDGRQRAIDRHHLYSAGFCVSQADIADSVRILADFRGDLLVTRHLLRAPA